MKYIATYYSILHILACLFICSSCGEAENQVPAITKSEKMTRYYGYYSGNPTSYIVYILYDENVKCNRFSNECFMTEKEEYKILPTDVCEHCRCKWSSHIIVQKDQTEIEE